MIRIRPRRELQTKRRKGGKNNDLVGKSVVARALGVAIDELVRPQLSCIRLRVSVMAILLRRLGGVQIPEDGVVSKGVDPPIT